MVHKINPLYPSKTGNPSGKGRGNIAKPLKNLIYSQKELDNYSRQKNPLDITYWRSRGLLKNQLISLFNNLNSFYYG